jgi:hypothetical protein
MSENEEAKEPEKQNIFSRALGNIANKASEFDKKYNISNKAIELEKKYDISTKVSTIGNVANNAIQISASNLVGVNPANFLPNIMPKSMQNSLKKMDITTLSIYAYFFLIIFIYILFGFILTNCVFNNSIKVYKLITSIKIFAGTPTPTPKKIAKPQQQCIPAANAKPNIPTGLSKLKTLEYDMKQLYKKLQDDTTTNSDKKEIKKKIQEYEYYIIYKNFIKMCDDKINKGVKLTNEEKKKYDLAKQVVQTYEVAIR